MKRRSGGMTLVELMIAMVLGLVVIGGVVSIVVANKQSYRTNEALSKVQESSRTAFEILARDVRQAATNGCGNSNRIANVLPGTSWWQGWFGVTGYDDAASDPAVAFGSDQAERVDGTDSLQLQGIEGVGLSVQTHDPALASLKINALSTGFAANDVLIVCDFDHSAIFQVSNYDSANVTVVHNAGSGSNCSAGLGYPTDCTSSSGNVYAFGPNSQIARFAAVDWFIGNNGRASEGGRSLFRRRLGPAATMLSEEIVAGVTDLQLQYRLDGTDSFDDASALGVGDWASINAVSISLTMDSADERVSTDASVNSGRLQRTFTHVVTLRNRVP